MHNMGQAIHKHNKKVSTQKHRSRMIFLFAIVKWDLILSHRYCLPGKSFEGRLQIHRDVSRKDSMSTDWISIAKPERKYLLSKHLKIKRTEYQEFSFMENSILLPESAIYSLEINITIYSSQIGPLQKPELSYLLPVGTS